MAYQYQTCISSNRILSATPTPTDPVTMPITLDQAKEYLKMTGIDDDNTVIERIISESVDWVQEYCGISVVENEVVTAVKIHNRIQLPYGPVKSIEKVNGVAASTTSCYKLFPATGDVRIEGVGEYTIEYTAGYDPIPAKLLGAMYAYIAFAYEHRGDHLDENDDSFAPEARSKANAYVQTIIF